MTRTGFLKKHYSKQRLPLETSTTSRDPKSRGSEVNNSTTTEAKNLKKYDS